MAEFWPPCAWPGRWLLARCIATRASWCRMQRPRSWLLTLVVHSLVGGVHGRLLQASRPAAAEIYSGAPVDASAPNLIVVIGESVALSRMNLYGYERQTTPRLAALRKARPADWVQMEKAVSNATATKVALPAMLTGLVPVAHARGAAHLPAAVALRPRRWLPDGADLGAELRMEQSRRLFRR